MKRTVFVVIALTFIAGTLRSQSGSINNTLGSGGTFVVKNAADNPLFVVNNDGGVVFSRMTSAERSAIASPDTGLLVYQTDGSDGFYYYSGDSWTQVASGAMPAPQTSWISPHYSFGSAGGITTETYIQIANPDATLQPGVKLFVYDISGTEVCETSLAFIGPLGKLAFTIPGSCPDITASGGWFEITSTYPIVVFGYIQRGASGETPQQTPLSFFTR